MFQFIPGVLLKQLYTRSSLQNTPTGFTFTLKNRLADAQFTGLQRARIDGIDYPAEAFQLIPDTGEAVTVAAISPTRPLPFPLRQSVRVVAQTAQLAPGLHQLEITLHTKPFGTITLRVDDELQPGLFGEVDELTAPATLSIPRQADDYTPEAVAERQRYLAERTQTQPQHLFKASFAPDTVRRNIEHFVGVAQVPIGLAGPLRVNGEWAQGDFLIPLATTEGTLVASYNRGIKLINGSGGVTCTVQDDAMQRAPVFEFADARAARDFVRWIEARQPQLAAEAQTTSSYAKLRYVDTYLNGKLAFLRFGYTTGDAAGQNMVTKATLAACNYILEQYPDGQIQHFFLESNMATDKKPSQINVLRTRGKRVTAEVTIPRALLIRELQVEPEQLHRHARVGQVGAWLAGTNNNGLHSVNGLAALFIATGQDVACLAESSAAIAYSEILPNGDLYGSVTLPSLIVATHGGGTGLPTQRECLELMDCYGPGQVMKFAEIVAGVIAAGELSLAAAISSLDWVSSHEVKRND